MTGRRRKVVRLNAETMPVLDVERSVVESVGADLVGIEGDTAETIAAAACDADGLIVIASKVRAPVMDRLERCLIVARCGTGIDNIDVDAATEHGIVVTNIPDFCIDEMADHTMALLLALARRIPSMHAATLGGRWDARYDPSLRRLRGRTLGLVGFGNTARAVARRAEAFGLRVIGHHHRYPSGSTLHGTPMLTLEELLENSDYVSLHVPLTEVTVGMISEPELRRMKPTAYLINIARGAVVDEDALALALEEDWIAGAGIDVYHTTNVFEKYGLPPTHALFRAPNIVFTPHAAACSVESLEEAKRRAAEQVVAVLRGEWPAHVCNEGVVPRESLRHVHPEAGLRGEVS